MSTPESPQPPEPTPSASPPESPPPPAEPQEFVPPTIQSTGPSDANSLRGFHFKRLMGLQRTWWLIGVPAVVIGVVAAMSSIVLGVIAAICVAGVGVGVVFAIADSKAADDFFDVYAESHNLELGGKTTLPTTTPLLRKGDKRYAKRTLSGEIAPGTEGMLALFTYEEQTTDANGNQQTNYYEYTLGMTEVPQCVEHVPELYCQRKSGLRSLEKFEDLFRRSKRRVTLESTALGDRYEIFVSKDQSDIWLRRLFSPSFIVWLADSTPDKFAFELVGGTLVAYVKGHKEDTADLDAVAVATGAVAKRLRDVSAETGTMDGEPGPETAPAEGESAPGESEA